MTPIAAHNAAYVAGLLPMWVIYDHPKDYPAGFVARMHYAGRGQAGHTSAVVYADTLDAIRDKLPPGLVNHRALRRG